MLETESGIGNVTIVTAGHSLALATAELRKSPASPQRLWEFQNAFWDLNRHAMGVSQRDVVVADCPWTEGQIRQFMGLGMMGRLKRLAGKLEPDFGLWLPEVASTAPEGLRLLDKAYPSMSWKAQGVADQVTNEDRHGNSVRLYGWWRTEAAINAPLRGRDEWEARESLLRRDRQGLTLNVYGVAGEQSRLSSNTNQFLDKIGTYVRVLKSRIRGRVVYAHFDPYGNCNVYWLQGPDYVLGSLGVRSVGV